MTQSIFRIKKDKDNPYVLLNKQFLNNADLTLKGKGLLTYLLSLPDDWKIYEDEIVKHHKDGKASVRSTIKELISTGYIKRERIRNSSGQLNGYNYYVYEIPTTSENPKMDKPLTVNSTLLSNNSTNNYSTNNENNYKGRTSGDDPTYEKECVITARLSISYYFDKYKQHKGKPHPKLKKVQIERISIAFNDYDEGQLEAMINRHFERSHLETDYNINHFATEGILRNLFYEAGLY